MLIVQRINRYKIKYSNDIVTITQNSIYAGNNGNYHINYLGSRLRRWKLHDIDQAQVFTCTDYRMSNELYKIHSRVLLSNKCCPNTN
jgi:hypothetical protein